MKKITYTKSEWRKILANKKKQKLLKEDYDRQKKAMIALEKKMREHNG